MRVIQAFGPRDGRLCPKCTAPIPHPAQGFSLLRYCAGKDAGIQVAVELSCRELPEHLHVRCHCGYEWLEETAS